MMNKNINQHQKCSFICNLPIFYYHEYEMNEKRGNHYLPYRNKKVKHN